jgi:hypothetical protein
MLWIFKFAVEVITRKNKITVAVVDSSYCFQSLRSVCSSSHELLILGISVRIFLMKCFPLAFCMIVFRHTVELLWTSDQPVSVTGVEYVSSKFCLRHMKFTCWQFEENVNVTFIHSQAPLIVHDGPLASLSGFLDHTHTIRHTVGLLWTSDQPVAQASIYTGQHNI